MVTESVTADQAVLLPETLMTLKTLSSKKSRDRTACLNGKGVFGAKMVLSQFSMVNI